MRKVLFAALAIVGFFRAPVAVAAGRPITVPDLLALQRIGDPQVSPDGARALYTVAVPDVPGNRTVRDIWIVSLADGAAKPLTTTRREGGARRSPDGRPVAFTPRRT